MTDITDKLAEALEPFANYADPRSAVPVNLPISNGSSLAKRQLTMGDCYIAREALAEHAKLMAAPPFKYVPNPESLGEAVLAAIEVPRLRDGVVSFTASVRAAITAYMAAEHAAGRARCGVGFVDDTEWIAITGGKASDDEPEFDAMILRLPEGGITIQDGDEITFDPSTGAI
jgi:hypothetical protein